LGQGAGLEKGILFAAEHQDLGPKAELPQPTEQLQAVHPRHVEVDDNGEDLMVIEQFQAGACAVGRVNVIAALPQELGQGVAPGAVVVDQGNAVASVHGRTI
jgi:hypothetical protein